MRLIQASGKKKQLKLSKKEWELIGKTAGWMDQGENDMSEDVNPSWIWDNDEELHSIATVSSNYGKYLHALIDLTNDIDDPEIQARADNIMQNVMMKMDASFKTFENDLMELDRLQNMWWASKGNESSFVMGELHEMKGGALPDVSGSKKRKLIAGE